MPIVLCRVDDRLIHGQVVVGWGQALGISRIILVADEVAGSDWEQELYRMAVTPEITIEFATVAQGAAGLGGWQQDPRRTVVLTGNLDSMVAAQSRSGHGAPDQSRRVHHRPGRRERLPHLYLTDDEMRRLLAMEAAGAEVSA
jgi:PTS system mannose-specific IIB component/fructoselysine and glucoselysine-specific PTS system IIB component